MDIKGINLVTPISPTSFSKAPLWQTGQMLNAIVVSSSPSNITLLSIGDQIFSALTPKPLAVGQALILEVTNAQAPATLKIIQNLQPSASKTSEMWKQILPTQLPLKTTFDYLTQLIGIDKAANYIPPTVTSLLRQLTTYLPTVENLSEPETLKKALLNSGVFFETNLANAAIGKEKLSTMDLKANLLRITHLVETLYSSEKNELKSKINDAKISQENYTSSNQSIKNFINENKFANLAASSSASSGMDLKLSLDLKDLATNIEGAISRITSHQLFMTNSSTANPQFIFELPIQNLPNIDILRLKVMREAKKTSDSSEIWRITIMIDISSLGPLLAKVTMNDRNCGVAFLAEKEESVKQINQFLPLLAENIKRAGFEVGILMCIQGPINHEEDFTHESIQSIIDLQV